MAILIEAQASEAKVLSEYEIERDKLRPSTNHAFLQDNISFELNLLYRAAYKVLPEIRRDDPPLVTIEILSPEQNLQDLIDKTDRYFEFGVKSCCPASRPSLSIQALIRLSMSKAMRF